MIWSIALALLVQPTSATVTVDADVQRMVTAAQRLTGEWPAQPPPELPEVRAVARHGRQAAPALLAPLPDVPDSNLPSSRLKVLQQATLALGRIYSVPVHCGIVYCDGNTLERSAPIKSWWQNRIAEDARLRALPPSELLARFRPETVFWRQFEIGRALADSASLAQVRDLEKALTLEDRHARGNVAYVLARLGHPTAFRVIADMLTDRSPRPEGQGVPGGRWTLSAQIRADRYYAAHLLGDLGDPRAVAILIPLLDDRDVQSVVPWSLTQIGDRRAVPALMSTLDRPDPSMRVLAISALEKLGALEALPTLRGLLKDGRKSNFGETITVAEAARHAIAALTQPAPPQPDFSGRWVLVSPAHPPANAARVLVVEQPITRTNVRGEPMPPSFLAIAIRREGPSGVTSETRMIGVVGGVVGGWVGPKGASGRSSTSSRDETRWDGNALVLSGGTYTRDSERTVVDWSEHRETWSLDSDGRLRIEIRSEASGAARQTETLLYRRQ
jgi:HEAT repeat protein